MSGEFAGFQTRLNKYEFDLCDRQFKSPAILGSESQTRQICARNSARSVSVPRCRGPHVMKRVPTHQSVIDQRLMLPNEAPLQTGLEFHHAHPKHGLSSNVDVVLAHE